MTQFAHLAFAEAELPHAGGKHLADLSTAVETRLDLLLPQPRDAHVGRAFQLLDDLKDQHRVLSDGKDTGQDIGKPTLLAPVVKICSDRVRSEVSHRQLAGLFYRLKQG